MSDNTGRKPLFDLTINIGALLQISTVTVGIVLFVAKGDRDVALVSQEVKNLRESVTENIGRLTSATADLRTSVSPLGSVLVRLDQVERRAVALEGMHNAQEARIQQLNDLVLTLRAQIHSNYPPRNGGGP